MSTHPTLTMRENPHEPNKYALGTTADWLFSILHNGQQTAEQQRDNIQRLAACWNKFDGIPTEGIEAMPGGIVGLAHAHAQALMKVDALRALVANIEAAAKDDTAWAAFRQQVIDCTDAPAGPMH